VLDWVAAHVIPIVLPVFVGVGLLWFGRRAPALTLHPVRTTWTLFLLLVVLNSIDTPAGDLITPTIAGLVSVAVCLAVYVALRRRRGTIARAVDAGSVRP
jgi:hypothetical protein